jgi:hypothetical protein
MDGVREGRGRRRSDEGRGRGLGESGYWIGKILKVEKKDLKNRTEGGGRQAVKARGVVVGKVPRFWARRPEEVDQDEEEEEEGRRKMPLDCRDCRTEDAEKTKKSTAFGS